MPRQIIRLLRGTYRRKALGHPDRAVYPPDAVVAFYGMLELAEEQPERGRFESLDLLRVLLAGPGGVGRRYARQVDFLVSQCDLVPRDHAWYVDGWDEMQEGDLTVAERVQRHRDRKRSERDPANAASRYTGNAGGNGTGNGRANGAANPPRASRADARPGAIADGRTVDGKTVDVYEGSTSTSTSGGARANGRVDPSHRNGQLEPDEVEL